MQNVTSIMLGILMYYTDIILHVRCNILVFSYRYFTRFFAMFFAILNTIHHRAIIFGGHTFESLGNMFPCLMTISTKMVLYLAQYNHHGLQIRDMIVEHSCPSVQQGDM